MVPATAVEINRQCHEAPGVCAIGICCGGYELAYLDVAIECGLKPNLHRVWQNATSQIAHSVIPSYKNQNKSDTNRRFLTHNKILMAFYLRSGVAHALSKLRKSPAMAYQT